MADNQQTKKVTLTVDQLCARIGIGRTAAYAALKKGDIPSIRVGRRYFIPEAALERKLACDQLTWNVPR